MQTLKLHRHLFSNASLAFREMLPSLTQELPQFVLFDSNQWNLASWHQRPGNNNVLNVYFDQIKNHELRTIAKIYVLSKRFERQIGAMSAVNYVYAIKHLDMVVKTRSFDSLSTADFIKAQKIIQLTRKRTSQRRIADALAQFGRWLTLKMGCNIAYEVSIKSAYMHGRKSRDADREKKLIRTEVLRELISANTRKDLLMMVS